MSTVARLNNNIVLQGSYPVTSQISMVARVKHIENEIHHSYMVTSQMSTVAHVKHVENEIHSS
jgi:hypothetical protein